MLKILVVDDDEVDRMAVRRALKSAGVFMEWFEVENCAAAIAITQTTHFDFIFLDYCLPDSDGLNLVKELRQRGVRVPLVVLTGQGDEEIAVELMKAGASDYLAKSKVSAETLIRILRNAMRVYRAEVQVALANQQLRESNDLLRHKNQELEHQRQQIQLQNLKLLEASRLKSQFLATMSHELRTPLNAIIGFSQMLLRPSKGQLNPQQLDMIQRILNNGKNLLELLNDILDLSKIEVGRLELLPSTFNLETELRTTIEGLRSLAEQKGLFLELQTTLQNPQITSDRQRLRQVVVNLLSNALKFTEAGGVWIEVSEPEPDHLAIAVHDTGIGIDETHLGHIFEAFRQVDQSITRRYTGTGLGLAITYSLVKMLNGAIIVESQLGKGSVFRIELPRTLSGAPLSHNIQELTFTSPRSPKASKHMKLVRGHDQ